MPLGSLRFALIWMAPSLSLLAACGVHRPLPLLDESGGDSGGSGGSGGTSGPGTMGSPPPPPRLIAPLSTATVTSQRPTLRWVLAEGTDGAHVQICRDRACAVELTAFDSGGVMAAPPALLPAGVLFWRAYGRSAGAIGNQPSPTWQMTVGARSAPVDTSWGTTLDVDGDGFADVIIGAATADDEIGRTYLYLGAPAGLSASPGASLAGPDAVFGFFGGSVASAGDVNGDGFADVIVGAEDAGDGIGRAYLYLGGPGELASSPDTTLSGPGGGAGFFGYSVASAGDVNGDGYADVLVGTDETSDGSQRAYLYLGGPGGLASSSAMTLSGPNGTGGSSVAGAGDVNGDGFADVVVGADAFDLFTGRVYLYLGGPGGLSPATILTGPDGQEGYFGYAVASAGDVDGDGYADVIVGAYMPNTGIGRAYLYRGGAGGLASSPAATLSGLDGLAGYFGVSVAGAGDIDSDGYGDVVVGASLASSGTGRAYLYRGGAGGLASSPAATLTGPDGDGGYFGFSVAGAGDVDGDGFGDVIIGAYTAGNGSGRAYLYRGGAGGLASSPSTTLAGADGATGYFGFSVASAGGPSPAVSGRRRRGLDRGVVQSAAERRQPHDRQRREPARHRGDRRHLEPHPRARARGGGPLSALQLHDLRAPPHPDP